MKNSDAAESKERVSKDLNRREFISRSFRTGVAVATVGAAGYIFHDSNPYDANSFSSGLNKNINSQQSLNSSQTGKLWSLPDFSISEEGGKLAIVHGKDRKETLNMAIKALGGIERFIKQGDVVLIKVNAAFAVSSILSATTHPDLLSEMVQICYKAGAKKVRITDNPINDPASCFLLTGIEEAAKKSGAELILPKESYFKNLTLNNARLIKEWPVLKTPFDGVTKLISMAPIKDHHRSGASMILKNGYGLLGGSRNIFHQDIHTIITELAMLVKSTLVVLDGTNTMMTNGPTGGSLSDLKPTNTMIVGTDPVAVDSFGATLLGKTPNDLPHLVQAAKAGVGKVDYQLLKPEILTI
ncbi:MAG: DUF362 domain-containing protein [Desulfamplus sp.]|nr:DUF362 domain-containing protein [Desulfamplus sp.]MBF0389125.1 DUF362 domain-containing protein [Desulfamplus sp.]